MSAAWCSIKLMLSVKSTCLVDRFQITCSAFSCKNYSAMRQHIKLPSFSSKLCFDQNFPACTDRRCIAHVPKSPLNPSRQRRASYIVPSIPLIEVIQLGSVVEYTLSPSNAEMFRSWISKKVYEWGLHSFKSSIYRIIAWIHILSKSVCMLGCVNKPDLIR